MGQKNRTLYRVNNVISRGRPNQKLPGDLAEFEPSEWLDSLIEAEIVRPADEAEIALWEKTGGSTKAAAEQAAAEQAAAEQAAADKAGSTSKPKGAAAAAEQAAADKAGSTSKPKGAAAAAAPAGDAELLGG